MAIHFTIHATEMSGFAGHARKTLPEPAARHLRRTQRISHPYAVAYFLLGRALSGCRGRQCARAVAMGIENAKRQVACPSSYGGEWLLPYHGHNVQYGVGGALMSGDATDALTLSGPLLAAAPHAPRGPDPFLQMAMGTAYAAEGRFGVPADVLALPEPGDKFGFARAYRHYARGEAQARLGNAAGVRAELAQIPDAVGPSNSGRFYRSRASKLMRIARYVLQGRAAMIEGRPLEAATYFAKGAKIDESKIVATLSDPPIWWYPVRRSYAAALLAAGKPQDALREANAVLAHRLHDPLTLSVRADAEMALGRAEAAAEDRALVAKGWHGDKAALALVAI